MKQPQTLPRFYIRVWDCTNPEHYPQKARGIFAQATDDPARPFKNPARRFRCTGKAAEYIRRNYPPGTFVIWANGNTETL